MSCCRDIAPQSIIYIKQSKSHASAVMPPNENYILDGNCRLPRRRDYGDESTSGETWYGIINALRL